MANNKTAIRLATQRQIMRSKLQLAWVRVHRPDVIAAIEKEVDAKYPHVARGFKALPKSLAALK